MWGDSWSVCPDTNMASWQTGSWCQRRPCPESGIVSNAWSMPSGRPLSTDPCSVGNIAASNVKPSLLPSFWRLSIPIFGSKSESSREKVCYDASQYWCVSFIWSAAYFLLMWLADVSVRCIDNNCMLYISYSSLAKEARYFVPLFTIDNPLIYLRWILISTDINCTPNVSWMHHDYIRFRRHVFPPQNLLCNLAIFQQGLLIRSIAAARH